MPVPTHLVEGDFLKSFPADVDEFPTVTNEENYIDAWLLNSAFNSLTEIETYLLAHRDAIEAVLRGDIIGIEGDPLIAIPPGLYPSYRSALAWDSNLLAENIADGVTIFGVLGTLTAGGPAGAPSATPGYNVVSESPVSHTVSLSVSTLPTVSAGYA